MLKNLFIISFSILALACSACSPSKVEVEFPGDTGEAVPSPITWEECSQNMGDHPCNLSLKDQNGNDFSLYDHYGKVIVLDFSAEWCPPCQAAAAEVQATQNAHDNLLYVTILIETNEGRAPTPEDCGEWADEYGITTAPVLAGNRGVLDHTATYGWPLTSWPTFFFITDEMILHTSLKGFGPGYIDALIGETAAQ